MNSDPTVTTSFDYLFEVSDDGTESQLDEAKVIILPPPSQTGKSSTDSSNPREERP